jgi:hypothetical protein
MPRWRDAHDDPFARVEEVVHQQIWDAANDASITANAISEARLNFYILREHFEEGTSERETIEHWLSAYGRIQLREPMDL